MVPTMLKINCAQNRIVRRMLRNEGRALGVAWREAFVLFDAGFGSCAFDTMVLYTH